MRWQQELPTISGDVLPLHLHAVRAMGATMASLTKGAPLLECQAQIRIRQRPPSMGMRRRKFLPLVPRTRHLVLPARGRIGRVRPSQGGLSARRMLTRESDVESAVIRSQIPLSGQSNDAREQPLMDVRQSRCPRHVASGICGSFKPEYRVT